ncbi:MAG: hypothetical protein JWO82_2927 [Akkermansiaceae bacterium]|nr:hypothetical protein [Akkermansiaceae bacterium]
MCMKLPALFLSLAALPLCAAPPVIGNNEPSGDPLPDYGKGYLTFYLDNDLFGGHDRDYTNGARLSWISENRDPAEFGAFQNIMRRFSGDNESFPAFQKITGFNDLTKVRYNYGLSLTQLMYTPEDPLPYGQPLNQRRYAGWLALGFSLHVKDDKILNSTEFTIGMTGPNSFAENTQDFIHDIRDIQKFNGWKNQIPNELTADLSFVQKRRADFIKWNYGAFRVDGLTEWGGRLGTFRTSAHVGGFFRAGYNLPPDFSDPRLSDTAYSHRYFDTNDVYVSNWSVYFLGGVTGRLVGYDATLDGPLFSDFKTGNTKEPLVGEIFAGAGIRYRDVEFSYVHTWQTEEYRQQVDGANFGSVAIRVKF